MTHHLIPYGWKKKYLRITTKTLEQWNIPYTHGQFEILCFQWTKSAPLPPPRNSYQAKVSEFNTAEISLKIGCSAKSVKIDSIALLKVVKYTSKKGKEAKQTLKKEDFIYKRKLKNRKITSHIKNFHCSNKLQQLRSTTIYNYHFIYLYFYRTN